MNSSKNDTLATDGIDFDFGKLRRDLSAFRKPRTGRSGWELAVTLIPFLALFALISLAVQAGYFLRLH